MSWRSFKASPRVAAWIAGSFLLVALGAGISLSTYQQTEEAAAVREHTYTVISGAGGFLAALKDTEARQRSYLQNADAGDLAQYLEEREKTRLAFEELRQNTLLPASRTHLDAVAPLLEAALSAMARAVDLRRAQAVAGSLAPPPRAPATVALIESEMDGFIALEESLLKGNEADLQTTMRRMLMLIGATSLLSLLFVLAFAWLLYRATQRRLNDRFHLETQQLLDDQEALNDELTRVNLTLRASEENLAVTLNSIGDAVIATDDKARVTRLNPVAEQLTGWTQAEACGRPVDEIFRIINQTTREASMIPVIETLGKGTVQGLANHTILIARDGSECAIADSCAPIRDRSGTIVGAVLVFRNVTAEYVVQQALSDSAAQIQAVLNTVVDGIITLHAEGEVVETVNKAAERMFGYEAAELVGEGLSLLIPELARATGGGAADGDDDGLAARVFGGEREVLGERKDGSRFPLEIGISELRLGGQRHYTAILRDVTARKQAEEALRKAGALQNAIFNSANFSYIATDARGVIQIFNVGAERMLGYAAADVINKITPAAISDPREIVARAEALSAELGTPIAPGFEALVFKASRGIEDVHELTYLCSDGARLSAVVSVTALRDAGNAIIGYLLIGTDNTAHLRSEAERALLDQSLQNKNVELERAKVVAEQANLAKSDFLSSMSHELRTPLGAILGFAQLVESGTPPPTPVQKRSIDQILKAGWYLLDLINEILDLALIESGKLALSVEPVPLAELMHECAAMIEAQAKQRGIRAEFPALAASCFVRADHTRLKQVLINLLSNAIKYNKPGGSVVVDVARNPAGRLRISVSDTGKGLSAAELAQLFQPFNRLGQELTSEQGTGIGLVVSKRLVEWMGGIIGVESTVGVGSVFWIEIDLAAAPAFAPRSGAAATMSAPRDADAAGEQTLLYVEDNPANLQLVEDIIARRPDIRLLSARDATSGIALARKFLPDAILMDINLPGVSGIEALHMLAADAATAHIPVIALSANAIPRDIAKGLQAGFFRYLTKPIKVDEFMETLDLALKSPQPTAPCASIEKGGLL